MADEEEFERDGTPWQRNEAGAAAETVDYRGGEEGVLDYGEDLWGFSDVS